ncbi:MAG: phenylalanine--tRNA ligase subunit alpha [Vampirovibrionales bacterium]|nr:phenylalanine--tRNA ligase subunit alpha [Vampirovibrionales bacterium]
MSTDQSIKPLAEQLKELASNAEEGISTAKAIDSLEAIRVEYVGRKGAITALMRGLKDVPAEERPAVGALANELQEKLSALIEAKKEGFEAEKIAERLKSETIDVTMPGVYLPMGKEHPVSVVTRQICQIFHGMGFSVLDDTACPEVETEYYNFEALNFPENHPARDMQDTYYTDAGPNVLLRSQTSNAQVRFMENAKKFPKEPIRVIAPGRVYRNEEVNSRKYVLFHQLEGLLVDRNVTFSDLKGILHEFTKHFFSDIPGSNERKTRFRASFFPFTEPSAEVDVECIFCSGKGCSVCGQTGWLEILGCGMVDPNVLKAVNIDPEEYTGFAFGMGIERLTMLKYSIQDIRLFFNGDVRVLKQFQK